jgi:hypothetical protein
MTMHIEPGDTPTDTTADLLAGFDAALADAGQLPEAEVATEATAETGAEEVSATETPEVKAESVETTETPAATEAKPADGKPSDEFGELPKDAKAETRERFDRMKASYDTLHAEATTLRTAATAAGYQDTAALVKDLPAIVQRAKNGDDLLDMVRETGADAEQYGAAIDTLGLINRAFNGGDLKAGEQAFEFLTREVAALGKLLGKDVAGVVDPLADHPDLLAEVEDGDLTRARALELAAVRNQGAVRTHVETTKSNATRAESERVQAHNDGVVALNSLGQQLSAADPAGYAAKAPALVQAVAKIKATFPPAQWVAATQLAYEQIVVAAPAPVATKPPPGPVRPNGPRPAMQPHYDNPMDALDAGIQAVNG